MAYTNSGPVQPATSVTFEIAVLDDPDYCSDPPTDPLGPAATPPDVLLMQGAAGPSAISQWVHPYFPMASYIRNDHPDPCALRDCTFVTTDAGGACQADWTDPALGGQGFDYAFTHPSATTPAVSFAMSHGLALYQYVTADITSPTYCDPGNPSAGACTITVCLACRIQDTFTRVSSPFQFRIAPDESSGGSACFPSGIEFRQALSHIILPVPSPLWHQDFDPVAA